MVDVEQSCSPLLHYPNDVKHPAIRWLRNLQMVGLIKDLFQSFLLQQTIRDLHKDSIFLIHGLHIAERFHFRC